MVLTPHTPAIAVKLFKRFKIEDLNALEVKRWSAIKGRRIDLRCLEGVGAKKSSAKKVFLARVLEGVKKKPLSVSEAAELDLIFVTLQPSSRKWFVHQLHGLTARRAHKVFKATDLQRHLRSELKGLCIHHDVQVILKNDLFWIRVELQDNSRGQANSAAYLVYCPAVSYICIANMVAKYRKIILQVLSNTFGCLSINKVELEGRCVKSLFSLLRSKNTKMYEKTFKVPPVGRQLMEANQLCYARVTNENFAQKQADLEYCRQNFGDDPQPTLETLNYRLETSFAGTTHAPNMPTELPFRCAVQFAGVNVLEGIRELVTCGAADAPLPNHLANVKSLARNKILIRPKQQHSRAAVHPKYREIHHVVLGEDMCDRHQFIRPPSDRMFWFSGEMGLMPVPVRV